MAPKSSAKQVDLGTKRVCPKCAAKFYDFAKAEIECPKCGATVDPNKQVSAPAPAPRPAPVKREIDPGETEITTAAGGDFESLDELEADDEEAIVGGLGPKDDDEDESF